MIENDQTFTPVAVGAMALHDRAFFAYLLESPREAMQAKASELKLKVTEDDVARVEKLINARKSGSNSNALELWDRWKATGLWDLKDWGEIWVPVVVRPPQGPGPQGPM